MNASWGFLWFCCHVWRWRRVLWLPSSTFDVINLWFVGVVPIIFLTVYLNHWVNRCGPNDHPRSHLFCASWVVLLVCLTIYACPPSVTFDVVNLCIVVCRCSPIINFVVALLPFAVCLEYKCVWSCLLCVCMSEVFPLVATGYRFCFKSTVFGVVSTKILVVHVWW